MNELRRMFWADARDDPFPGLRAVAADVLRQMNIDPSDRVAAAQALCHHLRSSGQYTYSPTRSRATKNLIRSRTSSRFIAKVTASTLPARW